MPSHIIELNPFHFLKAILLLLILSVLNYTHAAHVMTWVPPYGIQAAKDNIRDHSHIAEGLTRLGLQFWTMNSSGAVSFVNNGGLASASDVTHFTDWARTHDINPLLTVVNMNSNPSWDWSIVESILADTNKQNTLIDNLISITKNNNLGGVDIDFETPSSYNQAEDKVAFQNFINKLADSLHAEGLILTLNSFAATFFAPNWDWWSGITSKVDMIQSMGYEEIGYGCVSNSYCGYDKQINKAGGLDNIIMGVPGNRDTWLSNTNNYHLNGANTLGSGVAIWDLSILTSDWKSTTIWNILKAIKGSTSDVNSSANISSNSNSSSSEGGGFGTVLSDFAFASNLDFDGRASDASGNYMNGFWEAMDDQTSTGGTSKIEAYSNDHSQWYRLNEELSIEDCPTGDSEKPGSTNCFWGWNYPDAIENNHLNARLTITDYINPAGWGWANTGWYYFFDYDPATEDLGTAQPAALTATSTFHLTTTIPNGETIHVVLYESSYHPDSATGSRPTIIITGTGSEKTYTLQVQNFAPTWGTNPTDMNELIGIGFLRVEGADVEGEAIGNNAGTWNLKIRKLCLDGDCQGEVDPSNSSTVVSSSEVTSSSDTLSSSMISSSEISSSEVISSSQTVSSSIEISSSSEINTDPGFGTVLSDFAYTHQNFNGLAEQAAGNYLNGYWEAMDDQTSTGGTSKIEAYYPGNSSWYRLNEELSIQNCPTGDTEESGVSDCFWGWNYPQAILNNNLSARLTITDYVNPTGWGWANTGWFYFFDYDPSTEDLSTALAAPLTETSTFELTATIPNGETINVLLYESSYDPDMASGSRPTIIITGTGAEKTYSLQVQNFAPTWGTNPTSLDELIGIGFVRVEGAGAQGEAIGNHAGTWTLNIRKLCLNGDCQGEEDQTVNLNPQLNHSSFNITDINESQLRFNNPQQERLKVQIFNSAGLLLDSKITVNELNWSRPLQSGIYYISINNGQISQSRKLIIP